MHANDEIVLLASGSSAEMNLLLGELTDAGLRGQLVGEDLSAGLGTALPDFVELWVRAEEAPDALALLEDRNTRAAGDQFEPVAAPAPPMDGQKPIAPGDDRVEQFLVATDTAGGD